MRSGLNNCENKQNKYKLCYQIYDFKKLVNRAKKVTKRDDYEKIF